MADRHWLDTLSCALAASASRKAFLRRAGAAVVGLLLADYRQADAAEPEPRGPASVPDAARGAGARSNGADRPRARAVCSPACNIIGGQVCKRGQCICKSKRTPCQDRALTDFCCPKKRPVCCGPNYSIDNCCPKEHRCCPPGSKSGCCFHLTECCPAGSAKDCCPIGWRCCPAGSRARLGCCPPGERCCPTAPTGCCPDDQVCGSNGCEPPGPPCQVPCSAGLTCCVRDDAIEQCVDLQSYPGHCGSCNRVCPGNQPFCRNGQCTTDHTCPGGCPPNLTCCPVGPGALCVDLLRDNGNCGGCSNSCGNATCIGGRCLCWGQGVQPDYEPSCTDPRLGLFCCPRGIGEPTPICCGDGLSGGLPACCRPGGTCCPPRTDEDGKVINHCCPPGQPQCCPSGLNCCGADEICCPPRPGRIAGCCPANSVCTDEGCRAVSS